MLHYSHYVPVLRWKRGERRALESLDPFDKAAMTPLIEPLPGYLRLPRRTADDGSAASDFLALVRELVFAWGEGPIFIDLTMVPDTPFRGTKIRNIQSFFDAARANGVRPIPVTRLEHPRALQNAIRESVQMLGTGAALRVPVKRLQTQGANRELRELPGNLGLDLESLDMIVEYGLVGNADPSFADACHRVPEIRRWRTFTILSGSFPRDLMAFKRPGQYAIPRHEWNRWLAEVTSPAGLPRHPSFGDYTIQHPTYYEPVQGANPSASIRYTSNTYWVIMRGEGLRTPGSAGHAQYPANAELLCDRSEFCGPQFSAGDAYIWDVGSQKKAGPGSPETWLRAGINHHLAFVARQIQATVNLAETAVG